jgi:hypothetical protein
LDNVVSYSRLQLHEPNRVFGGKRLVERASELDELLGLDALPLVPLLLLVQGVAVGMDGSRSRVRGLSEVVAVAAEAA